MSRPTRLNAERKDKICQFISAGNDPEIAAKAAGISRATFFSWMARGNAEIARLAANPKAKLKATEALYVDFAEAVETARAVHESRNVLLIHKAAQDPKNWRAALEILERKYPERWGKINRTEVSGPDGSPVQIHETHDDPRSVLLAMLEKVNGKEHQDATEGPRT